MSTDAIRGLLVGGVVIGSIFAGSYVKRIGAMIGSAWRHRGEHSKVTR